MHRRLRYRLLGLLPTVVLLLATPAIAAPRLALVIGNAGYPARPLATSLNDTALVAQALAQAGFDVTAARDLDGAGMRATLQSFVDAARTAGSQATIFVYLSGYGVQYDGENFFVPIDARLEHDDDVPSQAVDLGALSRALAAAPARMRILAYDLARANSFATVDEMPLAAGLALGVAPPATRIAFNAAPGMVATKDALPYGAYARALAEAIGTPGLSAEALLARVRLRVGELTDGTEVPWDDGATDSEAFIGSDADAASTASPADAPLDVLSADSAYSAVVARDRLAGYAGFVRSFPNGPLSRRIDVLLAVRREALIAQAALRSDDPRACWTYMRHYPRGPHRFDVRRRLAALRAPLEPPPRFDIHPFPDLPPPTPAELLLAAAPLEAMRGLPPIPPPPLELLPAPDATYFDLLPPPAPAAARLLPSAAPWPHAARGSDDGRITQIPPGTGATVSETAFGTAGDAEITLGDADGKITKVATGRVKDGLQTILETGEKDVVLSRTTIMRAGAGSSIVQTGVTGGILLAIATQTDQDGGSLTKVTSGQESVLATWRRNADGIVVARDVIRAPLTATLRSSIAKTPVLSGSSLASGGATLPPVIARPIRSSVADMPFAATVLGQIDAPSAAEPKAQHAVTAAATSGSTDKAKPATPAPVQPGEDPSQAMPHSSATPAPARVPLPPPRPTMRSKTPPKPDKRSASAKSPAQHAAAGRKTVAHRKK